jgi:hypothetical protein
MLAEPRIMGTFILDSSNAKIVAPAGTIFNGLWTDQGYPFFSGTGVYRQTVNIPDFERNDRIAVRVNNPADMVEFGINGVSAGVRPWPPFEIDITNLVKPGANTLELKVTNSLVNLLLSEIRPSGLIKGAQVVIYRS